MRSLLEMHLLFHFTNSEPNRFNFFKKITSCI